MSTGQYTQEELAGLSDEEREAILEEDTDEKAALEEVAGEEGDDPDFGKDVDDKGDDKGGDGADKGGKEGDDSAAAAVDKESGKEAAAAADDNGAKPFVPRYQAEAVEGYDAKMNAFGTELNELAKKFKAGDIEFDEYTVAQAGIQNQRDDLRSKQLKAEIAAEQNEQSSKQEWDVAQDMFFARPENKAYDNKLLYAALDTAVREIASKPENAGRSSAWILAQADQEVRQHLAIAKPADDKGGKGGNNDKSPADKGKEKLEGRKPDLTKVPTTLGGLPSADTPDTGGESEFAYLDKLDGMELENALTKLTPEQEARYLRAS